MNITVVTGHVVRPPERRVLSSGEEVLELELTVSRPDGRPEPVPVAWPSAGAAADSLAVGDAVVVVGRVRQRFYRAAGATRSRTEVVADVVVPARRKVVARRAVERAAADLVEGGAAVPARATPRRETPPGAAQVAEAS